MASVWVVRGAVGLGALYLLYKYFRKSRSAVDTSTPANMSQSTESKMSRECAVLMGLAIGDSLGSTSEFEVIQMLI